MRDPFGTGKVQVWLATESPSGERKVLLLRTNEKRGSFWQPVTGGMESGESTLEAAKRELFEETGFRPKEVLPLGYEFEFEATRDGKAGRIREACFVAWVSEAELGQAVKLDPKEHTESKWVGLDEAFDFLKFDTNKKALEVLKNRAPDFVLEGDDGAAFKLSDAVLQGPILLIFYPGDFTPVCTKQLCSYRDEESEFQKAGVRVVGVSPDSAEKHREFRKRFQLPFLLLSDPDGKIFRKFSMKSKLWVGAVGRGIVLVDRSMQTRYRSVEWTPLTYRGSNEVIDAVKLTLTNAV